MSAPGTVRRSTATRSDWETPVELVRIIEKHTGGQPFTLDGAASAENAKAPRYYTEEDDAFAQEPQFERIFINPPYGDLQPWIRLFARWAAHANEVVALLPANTDTEWFTTLWECADEIIFLQPRVQFIGSTSTNPNGSMVARFMPQSFPQWAKRRPIGPQVRSLRWRE